jgi:hypothetical protein
MYNNFNLPWKLFSGSNESGELFAAGICPARGERNGSSGRCIHHGDELFGFGRCLRLRELVPMNVGISPLANFVEPPM